MRQLFMILFFVPAAFTVAAQNIDSLKKIALIAKDTNEIDCLNALSHAYILLEKKDSAEFYASKAGYKAKKLHYVHGLAVSLARKSHIAKHFDDDFIKSEILGKESLYWYERTGNKAGIKSVYDYIAFAVFAQSRFEEAIYYTKKKYALAQQTNSLFGKIDALNWLSAIYRQTGNYEKSFLIARECYDLALTTKNKLWISNALYGIGQLYAQIDDYPNALIYFRRVLQMDDHEIRNERIRADIDIWFKMEIAEVFSHLHQFDSAWYYYNLFKPAIDKPAYLRVYWISTGECYLLQKDYHNALKNFQLGLAEHLKLNDRNEIMRALLDIGKTYLALENNAAALQYGREGLTIALTTKAKQFIRDGFLILSTTFDRLQQADSANFYYRQYIHWKESMANDQLKAKFTAYHYEERIKLLDKENLLQQHLLKQSMEHKRMLIIGIGVLLLLGIIFIRFIMLKRTILQNELHIQKLENERKQAAFQQQTTELEMQALRAQMNPHFIFNCLSSINSFILKNESEAASDYLTKFARLIRMVMHNSKEPVISLEDELEMLQLYLDMERLRFKNAFDYIISFTNEVDVSFIYIPPLLLQPFAENAIWHGLLHKEGEKQLKIAFSSANNLLHCSIVDNGIGREAASTLKSKSAEKQKPMGLNITRERLALFNGVKDHQNILEIEDMVDKDGQATGTRVLLTIRVKRNTGPA